MQEDGEGTNIEVLDIFVQINKLEQQLFDANTEIADLKQQLKENNETINWLLVEVEKLKMAPTTPPTQVDESKKMKAEILLSMLSMQQQKISENKT